MAFRRVNADGSISTSILHDGPSTGAGMGVDLSADIAALNQAAGRAPTGGVVRVTTPAVPTFHAPVAVAGKGPYAGMYLTPGTLEYADAANHGYLVVKPAPPRAAKFAAELHARAKRGK